MAQVYIGLGSNLGDRAGTLRGAVHALARHVTIIAVSPLYETAPVGYEPQPWFLNAVVRGETSLAPLDLLRALKGVEQALGRVPTFANGPREIDVDLLLYDDLAIDVPAADAAEATGEGDEGLSGDTPEPPERGAAPCTPKEAQIAAADGARARQPTGVAAAGTPEEVSDGAPRPPDVKRGNPKGAKPPLEDSLGRGGAGPHGYFHPSAALTVPHPRLHERAFVLRPLADLAPDLVVPSRGTTVATLLAALDQSGVRLYARAWVDAQGS